MDNLALLRVFIALTKKKNKPSAQREYINYACVAGSGNGLIREKLVRKSSRYPSLKLFFQEKKNPSSIN